MILGNNAWAQLGLHTRFLSKSLTAQQYQPALLMFQDFKYAAVETEGSYWLGANTFTLDGIFTDGNYLSESSKDKLIGQLTDNNHLQQGSNYGIHANVKIGEQPISFSFRNHQSYFFEADDPNSAGLVLYGNARYAGDTISDDMIAARQQSYSEFGIGTGFLIGDIRVGVRAKLLAGKDVFAVDEMSYSLFTSLDGSQISVKSDYDIREAQNPGRDGWGVAADIGAIYDNDENLRIQASLTNLGYINWEGDQMAHQVDFVYEGVDARDFIGTNSDGSDLMLADSIRTLLFPDTTQATFRTPAPATGSIGIRYFLTEKDQVTFSVSQTFSRFAPNTNLPLVNVSYYRSVGNILTVGANIYSGGYDIFGAGIVTQAYVKASEDLGILIFAHFDNSLGLLTPSIGQGFSLNGGIGFRY